MKDKILIVEDDHNIADLIRLYLQKEDYEVKILHRGDEVMGAFPTYAPNIVLLDMMLPGMNGFDVLKEIRKQSNIPVIMVTARGETFDKVLGLELGADDYIVKPFEPKEMVARVKAVLRRHRPAQPNKKELVFPSLTINLSDYTVICRGEKLELPPKELELLYFLASNPNIVFNREQLLEKVWGFDYFGDSRTVDVHVKRIREKLGEGDPWKLKTVWGVGYKFEV